MADFFYITHILWPTFGAKIHIFLIRSSFLWFIFLNKSSITTVFWMRPLEKLNLIQPKHGVFVYLVYVQISWIYYITFCDVCQEGFQITLNFFQEYSGCSTIALPLDYIYYTTFLWCCQEVFSNFLKNFQRVSHRYLFTIPLRLSPT